ncbi:hypothetical protein QAD02_005082 [Eretmocerus hayati]|uniref:Uncharacterized protein n=1 Tax=Eretmocerus hayati TaxID=131215 RepID=A0ACC2NRI2_9HYME|nr:hypothetical protein QAD02_005082 [Eretmocerus hayati]
MVKVFIILLTFIAISVQETQINLPDIADRVKMANDPNMESYGEVANNNPSTSQYPLPYSHSPLPMQNVPLHDLPTLKPEILPIAAENKTQLDAMLPVDPQTNSTYVANYNGTAWRCSRNKRFVHGVHCRRVY